MPTVAAPGKRSRTTLARVEVFLATDGEAWLAVCPAFDLSTYGETRDDVIGAFHDAVRIFLEDTREKGTLENELLRLGWTLRTTPLPMYAAPSVGRPRFTHGMKLLSEFTPSISIPL